MSATMAPAGVAEPARRLEPYQQRFVTQLHNGSISAPSIAREPRFLSGILFVYWLFRYAYTGKFVRGLPGFRVTDILVTYQPGACFKSKHYYSSDPQATLKSV